MKEFELKYGCNPNQKPAKIYMADGSELPVKILSGRPGYINFLDAFNGWQLVSNLKKATGLPAATSFKHVSPAGAAVGLPLTETLAKIYWVNDMDWKNFSPLACAYARAHETCPAAELFAALREKHIYVRYFPKGRTENFLRITIGTREEMQKFIDFLKEYLK